MLHDIIVEILPDQWLNEAGFNIGQLVKQRIMPDCIITRQDISRILVFITITQ